MIKMIRWYDDMMIWRYDPIEQVEDFVYLGRLFDSRLGAEREIRLRIGLAAATFTRFNKILWFNKNIKWSTKLKVYKTAVLPFLLYGSETWVPRKAEERKLDSFDAQCLRKIMKVKWWHFRCNKGIRAAAGTVPPSTRIMRSRLRWFGHITRIEKSRILVRAFNSITKNTCKCRGKQKLRWIDKIMLNFKALKLTCTRAKEFCTIRSGWRAIVATATPQLWYNIVVCFKERRLCNSHEECYVMSMIA